MWHVGSEELWSKLSENFGNFWARLTALNFEFIVLFIKIQ